MDTKYTEYLDLIGYVRETYKDLVGDLADNYEADEEIGIAIAKVKLMHNIEAISNNNYIFDFIEMMKTIGTGILEVTDIYEAPELFQYFFREAVEREVAFRNFLEDYKKGY